MRDKKNINLTMTLKIVFVAPLVFLVIAYGLIIWIFRFSEPSISISEKHGALVIENVFLGEYSLGFTEVENNELSTGQTVIHAVRGKSTTLDQLILDPESDIASSFLQSGWTIISKNPSQFVMTGASYKLVLRGNNGFGVEIKSTKFISVPQLDTQQVFNGSLQQPIRLASRRD